MMKRNILICSVFTLLCLPAFSWQPVGNMLKTVWANQISPENVWQSYPRPQLRRETWQNLNGLWNYAITAKDVKKANVKFQGEVLVPFSIESSLSGVQKHFSPCDKLWYSRQFTLDNALKGKEIILHFEAVDYDCEVWVNNHRVGTHKGGNNRFSFDITRFLRKSGEQKLELSVIDPTDTESISRGKQQLDQRGIWYTPVSGIWKTVWIEGVSKATIESILPQSDLKEETVQLNFKSKGLTGRETLHIVVKDGDKVLKSINQPYQESVEIEMKDAQWWTPNTPQLYQVDVELCKGSKVLDRVQSYFAMREIDIVKDKNGYQRIALNGNIIFQYGTLDQGWWPDGLLTPPSEKAMIYDLVKLKEMGFNTLRKHIKVEPEQYYYYADSLGLMVWQDMVSGFATQRKKQEHVSSKAPEDWKATDAHKAQWEGELFGMIDQLRFYPSITTWVVFNEGWGQYDTKNVVNRVKAYDDTRIINGVSGWTDRKAGEMYDVHNYPVASMVIPAYNDNRISVLGEFGGYGMPIQDHLWDPNRRNWGYKKIDGGLDFAKNYTRVVYDLESLIAQGLAAAIYTQTTDVEGEVNGFMTYDRKVTKMPEDMLHFIHSRLYNVESKPMVTLIEDGQSGKPRKLTLEVDGQEQHFDDIAQFKGKHTIKAAEKFYSFEEYNNLVLWIRMHGKLKVWLNDKLVFNQGTIHTRHYNQFNVSNYSQYLRKGENELKVELQYDSKDEKLFDFGLTAY